MIGLLLIHLGAALALESPRLRDPEYGRRAESLRARLKEYPDRPLVLVLGSSRVAMGVRPDAWENVRSGRSRDPLIFNMGQVGAGPIVELLTLRRLYADGFQPSLVVVEYWPPFLRQDGEFAEAARFDPRRMRRGDLPVIRSYFPEASEVERRMLTSRLCPISENRERLLVQAAPEWMAKPWQIDGSWAKLDCWGWLPGMDPAPADEATRDRLTDHQRPRFQKLLRGLTIHSDSDRALRELASLAHTHGTRVALVALPDSPEFRDLYPPEVAAAAREYLARLSRDIGAPVIDAREWVGAEYLADGFHLSRAGAAVFTARLGARVAELPELREER